MNPTPDFFSEELRAAVSASRSAIEGLDAARDRVSADIKTLESYLERAGLKEPFRCSLGRPVFVAREGEEQQAAADLDGAGSASGYVVEAALLWAADKAGRMRLLYESSRWEGGIEVDAPGGPLFWDEKTLQRETKPLIETPFDVRKTVYKQLSDFVLALGNHLAVDPKDDPLKRDALPF